MLVGGTSWSGIVRSVVKMDNGHPSADSKQLVDAPPGPNRWFGTAPDCIPSPIAWKMSTYSFTLAPFTVRWAEGKGITAVQVEQICARPRKKKDDSDDDDDDDIAGDRVVDYIHDDTKDEDLEIWSITESTPFRHYEKHEVRGTRGTFLLTQDDSTSMYWRTSSGQVIPTFALCGQWQLHYDVASTKDLYVSGRKERLSFRKRGQRE